MTLTHGQISDELFDDGEGEDFYDEEAPAESGTEDDLDEDNLGWPDEEVRDGQTEDSDDENRNEGTAENTEEAEISALATDEMGPEEELLPDREPGILSYPARPELRTISKEEEIEQEEETMLETEEQEFKDPRREPGLIDYPQRPEISKNRFRDAKKAGEKKGKAGKHREGILDYPKRDITRSEEEE